MRAARPYGEKIRNITAHMSHAHPEYKHPYWVAREVKNVGIVVVTSDKGLCGGLNTNVLRLALNQMKDWESRGMGIQALAPQPGTSKRAPSSPVIERSGPDRA